MLSRLYDERVFTSSEDVVFSASSSQALARNGSERPPSSHRRRGVISQSLSMGTRYPVPEEEDEESKSDGSGIDSDGEEGSADDELEDEDEARHTAGLRFPLQSPRHIAASKSYLHTQRRRMHQALAADALSPVARRRHGKTLVDDVSNGQYVEESDLVVVDAPLRKRITAQYHDRPMELVYLPTGEIRPRDECPPGLKLPSSADVRKLLAAPESQPKKTNGLAESAASSTVHITRQNEDGRKTTRARATHRRTVNGDAEVKTARRRGERDSSLSTGGGSDDENDEVPESGSMTQRRRRAPSASPRRGQRKVRSTELSVETTPVRRTTLRPHKKAVRPQTSSEEDVRDAKKGDDSAPSHRSMTTSQRYPVSTTSTRGLEAELQKEKKRVLEKMTQLLEEQGKNQALQHKIDTCEAKMIAMEKELESSARRDAAINHAKPRETDEAGLRVRDERLKSLSDEIRIKDEQIHRLQKQLLDQHASASKPRREASKDEDKITRLKQREAALAKQLEELMNRVTVFHSQVETWKTNSREALETCDKKVDVMELLDTLWVDFPQFLATSSTDKAGSSEASHGESSTIGFLTKKLRQKEEELRLTHVKYVELKELCARQCIREADLQNFINDHRLRGNLVIPNRNPTNQAQSKDNQRSSHGVRHNGVHENQENQLGANNRHVDNQASEDNERGSEAEDEMVVRKPRVFIDIKRLNEPVPTGIEHVRLAPSPALAQRYHQQQQQQLQQRRAKGGTSTTSRVATVASASRSLATTRQTSVRTTTGINHSRASTVQKRPSTVSRQPPPSVASRRPSSQTPPLTSRPWV